MALYRFECREYASHQDILIEVNDAMQHATLGHLTVPCPECHSETLRRVIR